jgi:hypothetical protein
MVLQRPKNGKLYLPLIHASKGDRLPVNRPGRQAVMIWLAFAVHHWARGLAWLTGDRQTRIQRADDVSSALSRQIVSIPTGCKALPPVNRFPYAFGGNPVSCAASIYAVRAWPEMICGIWVLNL